MRTLRTRVVDTAGIEVELAWPVRSDQQDSHADAIGAALDHYDKLVGDSPMPASVQVTSTFMDATASAPLGRPEGDERKGPS